jgi:hypothetical protein
MNKTKDMYLSKTANCSGDKNCTCNANKTANCGGCAATASVWGSVATNPIVAENANTAASGSSTGSNSKFIDRINDGTLKNVGDTLKSYADVAGGIFSWFKAPASSTKSPVTVTQGNAADLSKNPAVKETAGLPTWGWYVIGGVGVLIVGSVIAVLVHSSK